jgi:hypothetical protein
LQGVALKHSPTTEDMGRLVQQLPWYYNASTMPHIPPLVENMVKKNRSRFPIVFLLTTLICSHQTTANLFFWFYECNFEILVACNTPLDVFMNKHFNYYGLSEEDQNSFSSSSVLWVSAQ